MKIQDEELQSMIAEIENSSPQQLSISSKNRTFELKPDPFLTDDLSGWIGALLVRSILHQLHVDEHYIFQWRVENKYVQYAIINHYAPGSMARTYQLSKLLKKPNAIQTIERLFKRGFFIKATLGHGSGRNGTFDRTADFAAILNSDKVDNKLDDDPITNKNTTYRYENWILQKKLDLKMEFRVHSFCAAVIDGLTLKIDGDPSYDNTPAEEFVKSILEKLPPNLTNGTLIAWDIGLTESDQHMVIEANFTGFHPEYAFGFQTSGYVEDELLGPIICAWLNNYFKSNYKISIRSVDPALLSKFKFLQEYSFYSSIFNSEQLKAVQNKINGKSLTAILYIDDASSDLMIGLITFLLMFNIADDYYIIVDSTTYPFIKNLFQDNNQIHFLIENQLFTRAQHQLIQQLSLEKRKQISCYHALRRIKLSSYVMF